MAAESDIESARARLAAVLRDCGSPDGLIPVIHSPAAAAAHKTLCKIIDLIDRTNAGERLAALIGNGDPLDVLADMVRIYRGADDGSAMLRVCRLLVPLMDDDARWKYFDTAAACRREGKPCIHGDAPGENMLPDGSPFYDVELRCYDGNDGIWVRTVHLTGGVLTELWRCTEYNSATNTTHACSYVSGRYVKSLPKRPVEDDTPRRLRPAHAADDEDSE